VSCDAKLAERRLKGEIAQVRIVWKNVPGNCLGIVLILMQHYNNMR